MQWRAVSHDPSELTGPVARTKQLICLEDISLDSFAFYCRYCSCCCMVSDAEVADEQKNDEGDNVKHSPINASTTARHYYAFDVFGLRSSPRRH